MLRVCPRMVRKYGNRQKCDELLETPGKDRTRGSLKRDIAAPIKEKIAKAIYNYASTRKFYY